MRVLALVLAIAAVATPAAAQDFGSCADQCKLWATASTCSGSDCSKYCNERASNQQILSCFNCLNSAGIAKSLDLQAQLKKVCAGSITTADAPAASSTDDTSDESTTSTTATTASHILTEAEPVPTPDATQNDESSAPETTASTPETTGPAPTSSSQKAASSMTSTTAASSSSHSSSATSVKSGSIGTGSSSATKPTSTNAAGNFVAPVAVVAIVAAAVAMF